VGTLLDIKEHVLSMSTSTKALTKRIAGAAMAARPAFLRSCLWSVESVVAYQPEQNLGTSDHRRPGSMRT
jgi:hypothetical protein